jgi:cobalamin synthase
VNHSARSAAATLASAVVLAVAWAQPAGAAASRFGQNLGDQARGLLVALFLTVAGLVALPVLGRRDVSGGLVVGLLVVILGGFAFAQGSVKQVIVEVWQQLVR